MLNPSNTACILTDLIPQFRFWIHHVSHFISKRTKRHSRFNIIFDQVQLCKKKKTFYWVNSRNRFLTLWAVTILHPDWWNITHQPTISNELISVQIAANLPIWTDFSGCSWSPEVSKTNPPASPNKNTQCIFHYISQVQFVLKLPSLYFSICQTNPLVNYRFPAPLR